MSANFDATVVNRNGRAIVFMRGEIDLAAAEQIRNALVVAQQRSADVIVDLSHVTFIDATGINALARAHREAPERRFHVVGATPAIRRVFDVAGVSGVLLEGSLILHWQRVRHHESGSLQWMTEESTEDGAPMAKIIEVGTSAEYGSDGGQYLLQMDGESALYESLHDAMTAAGNLQTAAAVLKRGEQKNLNK